MDHSVKSMVRDGAESDINTLFIIESDFHAPQRRNHHHPEYLNAQNLPFIYSSFAQNLVCRQYVFGL